MKNIVNIAIINCILSYKFCICFYEDEDVETQSNKRISIEDRVKIEQEAEKTYKEDSLGTIKHYKIPSTFKDFGRRFVFQYPYTEKQNYINITDESNLDKVIQQYLREKECNEQSIIPVKASPELVLAVAKQSALFQAATPINPADEVMQRNMLRTGDFWNDVVEEQVNPDTILRSKRPKKIDSIKLQFLPGSSLYELISELKKISPRLLYVINDDSE